MTEETGNPAESYNPCSSYNSTAHPTGNRRSRRLKAIPASQEGFQANYTPILRVIKGRWGISSSSIESSRSGGEFSGC